MSSIPSIYPQLTQHITPTSQGSTVCSYTSDLPGKGPILTLIHGYPQTAFIWRHVIPQLLGKISLFVPELPGYGVSTPCKTHSKQVVGSALLEAMEAAFSISASSRRTVILGGHDRGARICHRLVMDKYPNLDVVGTVLLDIVPTKAQWEAFANPVSSVAYFHWPLLANVEMATEMIMAYGGGKWCRGALTRICGKNEEGRKRAMSDNAHDVYAAVFERKEVVVATCEDYASGAMPEVEEQTKMGKKISVPALVMWSEAGLGTRMDCDAIWKDWVEEGKLTAIAVGNGYGHYLPEEACDEISEEMGRFVKKLIG